MTKRQVRGRATRKQLWALVRDWVAVGICVVTLVGGAAARFIPPETWWPLQILALALPALTYLLAAVAFVAGVRGRWKLAAFSFFPVGLVLILPMSAPEQDTIAGTGDGPSLRVVSFNAKPEAVVQGEAGFQQMLAEEQPHLVALQEFTLRVFPSGEIAGSPLVLPLMTGRAYKLARPEMPRAEHFVRPIFSQLELIGDVEFIPPLFNSTQAGVWASGGLTRARYLWEGTTISVYNIHLHSFSRARVWHGGWRTLLSPSAWGEALRAYRDDFRTRADQARAIRRLIDEEPHPFLVLGDFNGTAGMWVYAHLSRGLQDAFGQAGRGWGSTFPARLPLVRIDFILASKDWEVRSAHRSRTITSDHIPLVGELVLRTPVQIPIEESDESD